MTKFRYTLTDGSKTEWELHAWKCTHVRRGHKYPKMNIVASTPQRAVELWTDEELEQLGYSIADTRIMQCTANARQHN